MLNDHGEDMIDDWQRFHYKILGSNYREFFVEVFEEANDEIFLVICFVIATTRCHGAIVIEFFLD